MSPKKISGKMIEALAQMRVRGGELERWQGGFWTYPGCPEAPDSLPPFMRVPAWYVGMQTIQALLARGEIEIAERGITGGKADAVRVRIKGESTCHGTTGESATSSSAIPSSPASSGRRS